MTFFGTSGVVARANKRPFMIMRAQWSLRALYQTCLVHSYPARFFFCMMRVTREEEEVKGAGNHAAFSQS